MLIEKQDKQKRDLIINRELKFELKGFPYDETKD